jgi:hypothetical protein
MLELLNNRKRRYNTGNIETITGNITLLRLAICYYVAVSVLLGWLHSAVDGQLYAYRLLARDVTQ